MKEIKTGQEIWEIIKHPKIANMESKYIKDRFYEFELKGGKNKDGVLNSEARLMPTQEEIAEQEKQSRIIELESLINKGNKVGDDVSVYQSELKALYNGEHDTYIESIKQEALDNQILELMEGGLL